MVNAQEWLDKNYPKEGWIGKYGQKVKRNEAREIHLTEPSLEGELDLGDFTHYWGINIYISPEVDKTKLIFKNLSERNGIISLSNNNKKQERYEKPMEIDIPLNWTNVHPNFTPQLQKEWSEWGFASQTAKEWINTGFISPIDIAFVQWLKNWEHKTVQDFFDCEDKESLRKKYENHLIQYQVQNNRKSVYHPSDYVMGLKEQQLQSHQEIPPK